ncbi:Fe-S cluster assembly protein SufD [Lyngbya confervoides]|uniref:Fe-S cluster assembly protein SufD n=1 Tax=Lyngbya confervoides BDU141951 TaxID=1574623 RepID=A0ABD4T181_9CYAN|nr:Fe-S cluster assembly protein SufD [Lyngbya confervoides]MCM1982334.1 Fe-S cluster assembly protein SufD [Lyngbya confervoides BDU141951]
MSLQVSSASVSAASGSAAQKRQAYLAQLLAQRPASATGELQAIRDRALTLIQEQELPGPKAEDWRFTDLSPLYAIEFQAAPAATLTPDQLEAIAWSGLEPRIVFVNGRFESQLSQLQSLPAGVSFASIADLSAEALTAIGQHPGAGEVFTALNAATFLDVAVLKVARNQVPEEPIHLLFVTTAGAQPHMSVPRVLVQVETGAVATLIEDYVTVGTGQTFTNAVTEVAIAANAELRHTRIQRESPEAFHLGKTTVTQARDSRYRAVNLSVGGQISRHTPEVTTLDGQTETVLDGLTLAVASQLADTHSTLTFSAPHCTANQLHKCIVDDAARAVFNGKVFVPQVAQQTDAAQLSRNLLLSPKARVDTKPQLEIVADDVKCAHGATVSQLEEDEVFYLQSRGLDRENACDLLVKAFAAEILQKCPVDSIRQGLLRQILAQVR